MASNYYGRCDSCGAQDKQKGYPEGMKDCHTNVRIVPGNDYIYRECRLCCESDGDNFDDYLTDYLEDEDPCFDEWWRVCI